MLTNSLVRAFVVKACVSILNGIIYVHTYILVAEISVLSWELVPLRLLDLVLSLPVWEVSAQERLGGMCPREVWEVCARNRLHR